MEGIVSKNIQGYTEPVKEYSQMHYNYSVLIAVYTDRAFPSQDMERDEEKGREGQEWKVYRGHGWFSSHHTENVLV